MKLGELKTRRNVATEVALQVLAYNINDAVDEVRRAEAKTRPEPHLVGPGPAQDAP